MGDFEDRKAIDEFVEIEQYACEDTQMQQLLLRLPIFERSCLLLQTEGECSISEIAIIVEKSEEDTSNAIRRARRNVLYLYLEENLPELVSTETKLLKGHAAQHECQEFVAAIERGDFFTGEIDIRQATLILCRTCVDLYKLHLQIDQLIRGRVSTTKECPMAFEKTSHSKKFQIASIAEMMYSRFPLLKQQAQTIGKINLGPQPLQKAVAILLALAIAFSGVSAQFLARQPSRQIAKQTYVINKHSFSDDTTNNRKYNINIQKNHLGIPNYQEDIFFIRKNRKNVSKNDTSSNYFTLSKSILHQR